MANCFTTLLCIKQGGYEVQRARRCESVYHSVGPYIYSLLYHTYHTSTACVSLITAAVCSQAEQSERLGKTTSKTAQQRVSSTYSLIHRSYRTLSLTSSPEAQNPRPQQKQQRTVQRRCCRWGSQRQQRSRGKPPPPTQPVPCVP